jgi:hypothetical protein
MTSADAGEQILHNGCSSSVGPPCLSPESSSFEYEVTAPTAATYYLTANITTWHPNQDVSYPHILFAVLSLWTPSWEN